MARKDLQQCSIRILVITIPIDINEHQAFIKFQLTEIHRNFKVFPTAHK